MRRAFLLLTLLMAAGGCADGMASVHGRVTLDGVPVGKGSIAFYPVDGNGSVAGAQLDQGRYQARVAPGARRVRINASKVVGQRKEFATDTRTVDVLAEAIPAVYNSESKLVIEISAGDNVRDFDLKSR